MFIVNNKKEKNSAARKFWFFWPITTFKSLMVSAWNLVCGRFINFEKGRKILTWFTLVALVIVLQVPDKIEYFVHFWFNSSKWFKTGLIQMYESNQSHQQRDNFAKTHSHHNGVFLVSSSQRLPESVYERTYKPFPSTYTFNCTTVIGDGRVIFIVFPTNIFPTTLVRCAK